MPFPHVCGAPIFEPTHFLVQSSVGSAAGEWVNHYVKISDRTGSPPTSIPLSVTFEDTDVDPGLISGLVRITVGALEPRDVFSYRVYFLGPDGIVAPVSAGSPLRWIVQVRATGYDLEVRIPVKTIVPDVSRLVVKASDPDGDARFGREVLINDNAGNKPYSQLPAFEIAVIVGIVALIVVICVCGLIARSCVQNCRAKMPGPEDDAEPTAAMVVPVDRSLAIFEVGEDVEFWSAALSKFLPAIISGPGDVGNSYRVQFALDAKGVSNDAKVAKLRRVFNAGAAVEILVDEEAGLWQPGRVLRSCDISGPEHSGKLALYEVRLVSASDPLEGDLRRWVPTTSKKLETNKSGSKTTTRGLGEIVRVPAHAVRSHFVKADSVIVPWDGDWRPGTVVSAVPCTDGLPAQVVTVVLDGSGEEVSFSSAVLRK